MPPGQGFAAGHEHLAYLCQHTHLKCTPSKLCKSNFARRLAGRRAGSNRQGHAWPCTLLQMHSEPHISIIARVHIGYIRNVMVKHRPGHSHTAQRPVQHHVVGTGSIHSRENLYRELQGPLGNRTDIWHPVRWFSECTAEWADLCGHMSVTVPVVRWRILQLTTLIVCPCLVAGFHTLFCNTQRLDLRRTAHRVAIIPVTHPCKPNWVPVTGTDSCGCVIWTPAVMPSWPYHRRAHPHGPLTTGY